MKIVTIDDAENVILGLQDEIRRSEESRYDHRLHGVLLVAYGMNCCASIRTPLPFANPAAAVRNFATSR